MSDPVAAAIAAATGLDPSKDFIVQEKPDGFGPVIAEWNEQVLGPQPDDAQIAAWVVEYKKSQPSRDLRQVVMSNLMAYAEALIYANELGDPTKLNALKAKLAAAKADYDGKPVADPVSDPVTP